MAKLYWTPQRDYSIDRTQVGGEPAVPFADRPDAGFSVPVKPGDVFTFTTEVFNGTAQMHEDDTRYAVSCTVSLHGIVTVSVALPDAAGKLHSHSYSLDAQEMLRRALADLGTKAQTTPDE